MIDLSSAVVTTLVVLWTAMPLVRLEVWWIRAFEFPRPQVAVLGAVALVLHVTAAGRDEPRDVLVLSLLVACLLLQGRRLAPYGRWHAPEVRDRVDPRPEDRLRILVVNVLTPSRGADRLLELVRGCEPDIVLAMETDGWWESRLAALEADYPYRLAHPLDNLYGMHLYSRLELVAPTVRFLVEEDVPSMHGEVVLRSGHRVELHGLHPAPPSPTEKPTTVPRDGELLSVARAIDARKRSTVVLGDLNDVPWSGAMRLFRRISGLLDPRIGRGLFCTYHAGLPVVRWPLDHVLVSADFTLVSLERLPAFGSDHFPLCVELSHTPTVRSEQQAPSASREELRRARDKIEQAGAERPPAGAYRDSTQST